MVKGFIFFRTGKIPFVIENYRMDLFTDDSLLEIFCKEYNFKENYILQGLCFCLTVFTPPTSHEQKRQPGWDWQSLKDL